MQVESYVIKTLAEAGSNGLAPRFIARHVYNEMNTLFNEVDFLTVYKAVSAYLIANCEGRGCIIQRIRHGVYRLNKNNQKAKQLLFQFAQTDFSDDAHL